MAVKFTPEQQQAIDLYDCNILVSAAAGSGKTAVLSERIVKMVCREENPVDIDRLLVVTFTKAAAAEMRERISQAILKRLNEDGGNEHLQRQAAIIHNAQITTIDSFCLFVLRNNFEDIGLDPAFRIADEGEVELLSQDVMKEMLEEHFAAGEERFFHTIDYFCPNGRESVLESHILQLCVKLSVPRKMASGTEKRLCIRNGGGYCRIGCRGVSVRTFTEAACRCRRGTETGGEHL